MTNEEMLTALIHIKRNIRSKPIKKFIESKIACLSMSKTRSCLKTIQGKQLSLARSYQVTYAMPLYGQKTPVKIGDRQ